LSNVTRMSIQELHESIGFEDSLVDGSDVDRLLNELSARGGADAILGRFLRDKLAEYWSTVDPESCIGDES